MADLQKLVETGVITYSFSPQQGGNYRESRISDITRWRSTAGNAYSYSWFTDKWRYEIPLFTLNAAFAQQINTWQKKNTTLHFYPDLRNSPTTFRNVHIINSEDPMQIVDPSWKSNYQGMIILEQI